MKVYTYIEKGRFELLDNGMLLNFAYTSHLKEKASEFSKSPRLSDGSGKRDSNPRPSAWEADALPTELFPQICRRFLRQLCKDRHFFEIRT